MTPPADEAPDFDQIQRDGLEEAKRLHAEGHFDIGTDEARAPEQTVEPPRTESGRVGWRAPTYNELVRALRHSHEHHGFRPTYCTPKNCSIAEMLARIDAQGTARFRIYRVSEKGDSL